MPEAPSSRVAVRREASSPGSGGAAPAARPPDGSAPSPPEPRAPRRDPRASDGFWARLRAAFSRFWHTEDPYLGIVRDLSVAAAIVLVVMGAIWGYTAQPFPSQAPIVVVESGSMMRPDAGYGRLGTIDPGDLILVRDVDFASDVETLHGAGSDDHYGGGGDVIVYRPGGDEAKTPIIHRALFWVEKVERGVADCYTYTYEGVTHTCESSVQAAEIGLRDYRPRQSGFITKGDNPRSNREADQAGSVSPDPVAVEWVIGKARGEIPWFGLIKLALYGNPSARGGADPDGAEWCPVLAATAPCDLWVMLGISLGVLVLAPVALDAVLHIRRNRRIRRM